MISVSIILVCALAVTVGLAAISNERRLLLVRRLNQTRGIVAPIAAIILVGFQFVL